MAILSDKKFSFISNAPGLGEETFAVVKFTGFEGISRPYEFDILLVSENREVDYSAVLAHPVRLVIHRGDGRDVEYHGILREFEQRNEFNEYVFYRAVLAPRLWWLTLTHGNRVYLGTSIPDVVDRTLKDSGLASFDFEFRLQGSYPVMDYICQYGESHFDFMSRWIEREGIYYYFDQSGQAEKVIFTDTKISHAALAMGNVLSYMPPSGLDTSRRAEIIQSVSCRQCQLPRRVFLKDYNYEKPSLEITGSADVDAEGRSETYLYGEHFPTTGEGDRLARIRAEELYCRKKVFFGESTVPFLMPGFTFTLADHYRSDFNRGYLVEEVTHEGNQTGFLISGIVEALSERENTVYYHNSFKIIPSDVQYRPGRHTPKPRIHGTVNAHVDAEGSGSYAELDSQGRYKVRLPFDIDTAHGPGKASHFVRMAQPYSGSDYGVHFPLHKGAEVLLTFIDGDPDRPLIAGAVPNPETISPVTAVNQTKSVFRDNYGNELIFDSTPGDEHIRLYSPHHKSKLELGKSVRSQTESDGFDWKGGNTVDLGAGNKFEAYAGNSAEATAGMQGTANFGLSYELEAAGKHSFLFGYEAGLNIGPEFTYRVGASVEKSDSDKTSIAAGDNIISAKKVVNLVGGAKDIVGSTSIASLDESKITLSVGTNKNPDSTKSSKIVIGALIATPIIGTILAAIFGGFISLCLEDSDEDRMVGSSIALGVIEGVLILANIVIMVLLGIFGLNETIKPVSHTDVPASDKIDAILELDKTAGINAEVKSRTPVATNAQIKMNLDGSIVINSKPSDMDKNLIEIGVGDITVADDAQDAKLVLRKADSSMGGSGIELQCGKAIISLVKDGGIFIKNEGATVGNKKIVIGSQGGVLIKGVTGDIVLDASAGNVQAKGSVKHKHLTVLA